MATNEFPSASFAIELLESAAASAGTGDYRIIITGISETVFTALPMVNLMFVPVGTDDKVGPVIVLCVILVPMMNLFAR